MFSVPWARFVVAAPHPWGQNVSLHPHIHCIVPGGGIYWKAGPASVAEYLGRYTHKIAIPNHRLLSIDSQGRFISPSTC